MDTTEPVSAVPLLPTGNPEGPTGSATSKKHWHAKKAVWIPVVVVVLVAALTGVLLVVQSSSNPSTTAGSPGATTVPGQGAVGTGYLAHASNGVIFIQWTQNGTSVNGTAEVDTLSGPRPTSRCRPRRSPSPASSRARLLR